MPKIQYDYEMKLSKTSLNVIEQANDIIYEYQRQGYSLTLRQLYYQFVARGLIPNKMTEYKRLGDIINNGRLCGLIDWKAIEDRTRNIRELPKWDSPEGILEAVAEQFRRDKWLDQPIRVEAWIEKDALIGVIEGICNKWEIPHFSCRGYVSQSEMWEAAMRIQRAYEDREQSTVIIHLGDHDPSGIDMSRDINDRICMFLGKRHDYPPSILTVNRIALNMEQVRRFNPPPNPAKLTDSRCKTYMEVHGDESWELDALDPRTLSNLIQDTITENLDQDIWDESVRKDEEDKETLQKIADQYDNVKEYVK